MTLKFRDLVDNIQGDFYLEFDGLIPGTGIRFVHQDEHLYNADEILDGEDSLPKGYNDCGVIIKPYDRGTLLVRVKVKHVLEEKQ
jgi:hypothetical protein